MVTCGCAPHKPSCRASRQCQTLKVHYTIDNETDHAPVALSNSLAISVPFSSTFSKSEVLYNVLDNFYDPDGDVMSVKVISAVDADVEQKNNRRAFVKTKSTLNSFVDSTKTLHIYGNVFYIIAIACGIATVVLFSLTGLLKKWMHGVS